MAQLLSDPAKLIQIIVMVIIGFVCIVGYITGKQWSKKGPPKLPIELYLSEETSADLKAIRKHSEAIEEHTATIANKLNTLPQHQQQLFNYHKPED